MEIEWDKIEDWELDGIDTKDYPDFCDTYISRCIYKGKEATEKELEAITEGWDLNMPETLAELAFQHLI